jgi:kynureninase
VRPDLVERFQPAITGWAAHAAPFAFETGAQRYVPGIKRMLHGSPSVASFYQATAGYEIVQEVGVAAIREHSMAMTRGLWENIEDRGFTIHSPPDANRRGGTLTVSLHENENGPAFVKALEARGILVDHRPEAGIRVSPHFYNLEEELEEFADALSDLRESHRWREHVSSTAAY